jgi:hypothetical protein
LWDAPLGSFADQGDTLATAVASPDDPRGDAEIAALLRRCIELGEQQIETEAVVGEVLLP